MITALIVGLPDSIKVDHYSKIQVSLNDRRLIILFLLTEWGIVNHCLLLWLQLIASKVVNKIEWIRIVEVSAKNCEEECEIERELINLRVEENMN